MRMSGAGEGAHTTRRDPARGDIDFRGLRPIAFQAKCASNFPALRSAGIRNGRNKSRTRKKKSRPPTAGSKIHSIEEDTRALQEVNGTPPHASDPASLHICGIQEVKNWTSSRTCQRRNHSKSEHKNPHHNKRNRLLNYQPLHNPPNNKDTPYFINHSTEIASR